MSEERQGAPTGSLRVEHTGLRGERELRGFLRDAGYPSVLAWHDPGGACYPPHRHGHDELIAVVSGTIAFEVGGTTYALGPGDVLHLPAGTLHAADVPPGPRVAYLIGSR